MESMYVHVHNYTQGYSIAHGLFYMYVQKSEWGTKQCHKKVAIASHQESIEKMKKKKQQFKNKITKSRLEGKK